jgi:hypothetical protein
MVSFSAQIEEWDAMRTVSHLQVEDFPSLRPQFCLMTTTSFGCGIQLGADTVGFAHQLMDAAIFLMDMVPQGGILVPQEEAHKLQSTGLLVLDDHLGLMGGILVFDV